MSIKVVKERDVHVTAGDLARYMKEYHEFMRFYAGSKTFDEFVRDRRNTSEFQENKIRNPERQSP